MTESAENDPNLERLGACLVQWWIYYLLLFIISATVVSHFQFFKRHNGSRELSPTVSSDSAEAAHYLTDR